MIATKSSYRSKARKTADHSRTSRRETKPVAAKTSSSRPQAAKKSAGLKFEPLFHTKSGSPFDHVEWDKRTAEINDDSGKAIFKQENVEVPRS